MSTATVLATSCFYPECFAPDTEDGRQYFVAYWFDKLGRHLLKTKILSPKEWLEDKCTGCFDLDHHKLFSYVEFKGASNTDQLKLFESQLDAQMEELGFPVDDGFIWIFSYNNRDGANGRKRLLNKNGGSHKELSEFLAEHTNTAYVVEIRLFNELRNRNSVVPYSRDKYRVRNLISISRTGLKFATRNTRTTLADLGLYNEIPKWLPPRAKSIPPRIIETEIDGHTIRFELFVLLPNGLKMRFLRQLNGVVKRECSP